MVIRSKIICILQHGNQLSFLEILLKCFINSLSRNVLCVVIMLAKHSWLSMHLLKCVYQNSIEICLYSLINMNYLCTEITYTSTFGFPWSWHLATVNSYFSVAIIGWYMCSLVSHGPHSMFCVSSCISCAFLPLWAFSFVTWAWTCLLRFHLYNNVFSYISPTASAKKKANLAHETILSQIPNEGSFQSAWR